MTGVSGKPDRAVVNGAEQVVSAVPASIPDAEQFCCPDCDGHGWTQGTDFESQCCGGSDWECGARGCSGPIQVPVPVQEQCEYCLGTGDIRARDAQGIDARSGETADAGSTEGESPVPEACAPTPPSNNIGEGK